MTALLYYLLKVILCSGVLFLYYDLALRNRLFHQWNRFFLLAAVLISLIIPSVKFRFVHSEKEAAQAVHLLRVVESADEYIESISIQKHSAVTYQQWALIGYGTVSLISFILLFISLLRISFILKKYSVQYFSDIKFLSTQERGTPFSFLRYIFWNKTIDLHSPAGQQIFQHELVHVKEGHTWDKLFLRVVLIAFWANPFFWLIRKELSVIHEFIADKKAVKYDDSASLAAMILQISYPAHFLSITNPFFQSSIKRRILMLTKIQNAKISYAGRILALPLMAIIVLAFSFRTEIRPIAPLEKSITVVIDAGHGKTTNGQMSGARIDNVYEDEIVLNLAKRIKELNTNDKIKIVLSRASEGIVDLHKRVDFAREKAADLFISLHVAAAETGKAGNGMEVYVSGKNTPYQQQTESLGSVLKEELNAIYPTNPELIKRKTGIWVIDQNICPSVLVECGYITDAGDRDFITKEANQKIVAQKIIAAIERYSTSFLK